MDLRGMAGSPWLSPLRINLNGLVRQIASAQWREVVGHAGHGESRQLHVPEDGGHRGIRRITSRGDPYQTVEGSPSGGIEDKPVVSNAGFEAGVEIRRLHVAGVSRKVPGGNG
jgi:hypothetical protein